MPISDRIQNTLTTWSKLWGAPLGAWLGAVIGAGIEVILDKLGKKNSLLLKPLTDALEKAGGIPPELKPILDEVKNPTGESAAALGAALSGKLVSGIEGDVFKFLMRSITYAFSFVPNFYIPKADLLLDYKLRHLVDDVTFYQEMRMAGIPPERADELLKAKELRFPSDIAAQLYFRDPVKYGKYLKDLQELGIDPERAAALIELEYKFPTPENAIRWMAREVFEPEMVRKYGLDDEFGGLDHKVLDQIGIKPEHQVNYWRAHWEHASWSQMVAMLHRGALGTEGTHRDAPKTPSERSKRDAEGMEELYNWFRLVEIPPYWRDGLINTAWNVPGRVEARMLAQYGLVDKKFLVELLARDGLAEEYRDIVADMMLVRGIRTDIQTRYAKKWLTAEEVKTEINSYGLSQKIADRLYQWIVTNAGPERTAPEKDLTASEILQGVKKRLISWDDGKERLQSLGYDETEAVYKLAVYLEAVPSESSSELTTRVDTIRRSRRQRMITREQEQSRLLDLGLEPSLAAAYTENDDLRLVKAPAGGT